jgi:hypothetical protein
MNKLLAGVSVWFTSFKFTRDVTVIYIGVPLNVLVACAIGAFCSFSFGDKVEPRRKMWGLFVACMCMGAAATAICNAVITHWLSLEMTDALQAGMGAAVAFTMRFFLPWFTDVVKNGKWISWIPFNRSDK